MRLYYCLRNKVDHRDISPLLQKMRNVLLGRTHTPALRYTDEMSCRTQPPPNLPDGQTHKLSDNYYFTRDVRREVKPPEVVAENTRQLEAGGKKLELKKLPTPGAVHQWDTY